MINWPQRWGFLRDLRDCKGKCIERVELHETQYGSVNRNCWLLKFTDGTRAFVIDHPVRGFAVGPSLASMKASDIITPEEYGQTQAHEMAQRQKCEKEELERRRRVLEQLKKELGEP